MKRKRKTKLPKNNGRPQLWMRDTSRIIHTQYEEPEYTLCNYSPTAERVRIIYPNGKTEYTNGLNEFWGKPCWAIDSPSVLKQVKSMLEYDAIQGFTTIFLGYL